MAEYPLEVHLKLANLEKDIEILRVQTNEHSEIRKDQREQILTLSYKLNSLEASLNNLKERFEEKLDDLYEDQRGLMAQQRHTSDLVLNLTASINSLNMKIDAATAPRTSGDDDNSRRVRGITFSEGNWNTLIRLFILIFSVIAFLLGAPESLLKVGGGG